AVLQKELHTEPDFLASAEHDCYVYINRESRRMRLYPMGLKGGGSGKGMAAEPENPGLIAVPGQPFSRKLFLPEGATATLESGPAGMTVEPGTPKLVWSVPAGQSRGEVVQVILLIRKADGSTDYQIEKISVP
ncbi:MAG: hypothetical protein ACAI34_07750, partial [Verrucomicrobium sp.]|nr:hypothetical protein [Verrucomicrobium sp.]